MTRNFNLFILYQSWVTFWAMIMISIGFFTTWILLYLKEPKEWRGPGINLKEL
jgi:hypothetical protein